MKKEIQGINHSAVIRYCHSQSYLRIFHFIMSDVNGCNKNNPFYTTTQSKLTLAVNKTNET